MTDYAYRMPWGEGLTIRADLSRADSPIYYIGASDDDDEENWVSTPYETASAGHSEREMLRLVVEYLGPEWYADPSIDPQSQLDRAVEFALANR